MSAKHETGVRTNKKKRMRTSNAIQRIGAALLLLLASAHAQDDKNNEIGFLLGRAVTPSHTAVGASPGRVEIGGGTSLQATYARRLHQGGMASLYLERPFAATLTSETTPGPQGTTANYATRVK